MVRTADLEINLDTRNVHRGERRIDLAAREHGLLVVLARNAPGVLSRAQVLDRIWEDRSPRRAWLIHTVRGVGYTLCPA